MIYYADKTCSSTYDTSKTIVGVVVKYNELVMSKPVSSITWASNVNIDVADLPSYNTEDTARTDYNGKANTVAIVSAYSNDNANNNAAKYCISYSIAGTVAGQWYLPAAGELYAYWASNFNTLKPTLTTLNWSYNGWFWSSTEIYSNSAWGVFYDGRLGNNGKLATTPATCFYAIN